MADETTYLYTDGASKGNPGPAGAGFVLTDAAGNILVQRSIPLGVTTVGVAEYKALIAGLSEADSLGRRHIHVYTDSEFMARQMLGIYKVRTPAIRPLYEWANKLRAKFTSFKIQHVPREMNNIADGLATEGARQSAAGPQPANGRRAKP
jgi:ribonuclease HI